MNDKEVEKKVRMIIAEKLKIDPREISLEKNLTKDLGADSLDAVELLMSLEENFEIEEIPEQEAEKIQTVNDIIEYIKKVKS